MATPATGLLNLPKEILENTLLHLDPIDVAVCAATCRTIGNLVYSNSDYLWRSMFLLLFDDPRGHPGNKDARRMTVPWQLNVQKRIRARQVARSASASVISCRREDLQALLDILAESGDQQSEDLLSSKSKNIALFASLFSNVRFRDVIFGDPTSPTRSPLFARLHVHYGLADEDHPCWLVFGVGGWAVERVYTMDNFSKANNWGPFIKSDTPQCRRPDWCLLEAIMIVCGRAAPSLQAVQVLPLADQPVARFHSARPYTAMNPAKVEGDWAGVTGRWYRLVAYLSFQDLWLWNWSIDPPESLDGAHQVINLWTLDLEVVSVGRLPQSEPLASVVSNSPSPSPNAGDMSDDNSSSTSHDHVPKLHPGGYDLASGVPYSDANSKYPTIFFKGAGLCLSDAAAHPAQVRGRVDMGVEGDVLWRMAFRFNTWWWVIEGVQIGGIQSQFGFLGVWSQLEHDVDDQGPGGPTWMWKSR